jgi:hypothetical protein
MSRNVRSLIRTAAGVTAITLAPIVANAQDLPAARGVVRDYAAEAACAAHAVGMPPDTSIRVGAGRERGKALFGANDALVITSGTARGLKVGQEYFVRRIVPDRFVSPGSDGVRTSSIHTAGWIRIVDAQSDSAIATVTRLCDGIQQGDFLEPFQKPVLPAASATPGEPDFANPGHLVMGDERRQMAAQGDLLILDRGSDHGVHGGQHLTIFRPTAGGTGPIARIAEATAVLVSPETTVIRIDKTTDAVFVGDLVAIHR